MLHAKPYRNIPNEEENQSRFRDKWSLKRFCQLSWHWISRSDSRSFEQLTLFSEFSLKLWLLTELMHGLEGHIHFNERKITTLRHDVASGRQSSAQRRRGVPGVSLPPSLHPRLGSAPSPGTQCVGKKNNCEWTEGQEMNNYSEWNRF